MQHLHLVGEVRTSCVSVSIQIISGLTVVGLYGMVAYLTSQRTRELGVRIALGATARNVVQLVVTEAARLTLLGAAIGFAGAYVTARLLRRLLFGVAPKLLTDRIDPTTEAVIARVSPDPQRTTDVGSPVKNSILAVPGGLP